MSFEDKMRFEDAERLCNNLRFVCMLAPNVDQETAETLNRRSPGFRLAVIEVMEVLERLYSSDFADERAIENQLWEGK